MSCEIPADFKEDKQLFLDLDDPENTDVYLIRVPKGFDISKLHGAKFSANELKQIGVEERTDELTSVYELGLFNGQEVDVAPLIRSGEAPSLGPSMKGFLSVNKSYKADLSATFASHKVQPVTRVPMPEGLRVRFRPFGASAPYSQSVKKKKKRKHFHDTSMPELMTDIFPKKKRQKTNEKEDSDQHFHKKHKNKKKKCYVLFCYNLRLLSS